MALVTKRGLLASALCLVLILPSISFVPASAAAGEWTMTIDEDYSVYVFDRVTGHAELTFTVDEYGIIDGSGSGWEQYVMYDNNNRPCDPAGADNIAFKVSGFVDNGEARIDITTSDTYYVQCESRSGFERTPFSGAVYQGNLKDGASYVDDGYFGPDSSGTVTFVIRGSESGGECPQLTITPTLPPASDPRNLAGPTDTASYRLQVAWGGKTPIKVNFNVQGGTGDVSPSFVFNPANMQTSPISVLMDVTTNGAAEGVYPLTVDAWVIDPDTGQECHAIQTASVTLVVSTESRASVLLPVKQSGDVRIMQEAAEDGTGVVVETGNDGAVTFTKPSSEDSSVTVDVKDNTRFTFDQLAKMIEKARDQESAYQLWANEEQDEQLTYELGKRGEDEQFAYELWESQEESLVKTILGKVEKLNDSILKFVYDNVVTQSAGNKVIDALGCVFYYDDPQFIDYCNQKSMIFLHKGELHVVDAGEKSEEADRVNEPVLLTDNSFIIPTDTEFTVKVQQSRNSVVTTVTMLEGSALVVDLISEDIKLVNAGQQYSMEAFDAGDTINTKDNIESASQNLGWWKVQIGDYATARDIDTEDGAKPVGRTSLFSDNEYGVWVWLEFLNVPAEDEHKVDFKWYAPDGSLYDTGNYPIVKNTFTGYWNSYHAFDLMGIGGLGAAEKTGQWKVEVDYDGDIIKEIQFYIAKNTLVENQSVTYAVVSEVKADSAEIEAAFQNDFARSLVAGFAGAGSIGGIDDIEWLKTTVLGNSAEGRIQDSMKLRGRNPVEGEPRNLSNSSPSAFIPTIGIDENLKVDTGFGGLVESFPAQLDFDGFVDLNIGGAAIKAYQFSGTKRLAEGNASSDITITNRYEKITGVLVDYLISGSIVNPETGKVEFDSGVRATQLSIPTTLTIYSIPSEVQQNQQVSVTGYLNRVINEGQVVLTYKKNDSSDEPIKRTVPVINGTFSDSYNMEKDGTYTVTAEYLGSGAFLSSTTDAKTLTVTPSGCLIATAAFGSELTPQVQFLRSFRDNHILSTAAGSSFMNAFNAWYYSFSPAVADYEREQPWLQQIVKAAIYPLLGILTVSERAYASMPGEYGAVTAGTVASSMIGAVYFWPVAFAAQRFNRRGKKVVNALTIILTGLAAVAASLSILVADPALLTMTTSLLVLTIVTTSALFSARLVGYVISKVTRKSS